MLRALGPDIDWRKVFAKAIHGHTPPVEPALSASRAEADELRARGVLFEGARVLDLGCGNGRQIVGLLNCGLDRYVGVDAVRGSIEFCIKEISPLVAGAQFIHLDLFNTYYNPRGKLRPEQLVLPFEGESFDAVIAGSVFTHLGTAEVSSRYLSEISRILRPAGKLFSSWFRSPPNDLAADHIRTVFEEGQILRMVTRYFRIYHSRGGFQGNYNDQWCLFCEKI